MEDYLTTDEEFRESFEDINPNVTVVQSNAIR
jgi:hypothetical protein